MKLTHITAASMALAAAFSSCQTNTTTETETTTISGSSGSGINLAYRDTTASPADDFYRYVNGLWLDSTEIPATEGRWGAMNELRENNQGVLRQVLEKASANTNYKQGSPERKVADFYAAGMDTAAIEKAGMQPLEPVMAKIASLRDKQQIQTVMADMLRKGSDPFIGIFTEPDLKKSTSMALYVSQAGLGLPDRDYYFNKDKKSEEIRKEYVQHIANMLKIAGATEAEAKAAASKIMKLETDLAKASYTRLEQRDMQRQYNKTSIAELNKMAPAIDWKKFIADLGAPASIDTVIVLQPEYLKAMNQVISSYPLADLQTYLRWNAISNFAPYLHSPMVQESFRFNSTVLSGVTEMKPRWKRVLTSTNRAIGEALGKLYVAEHFPPEAKQRALEMVDNIKTAFATRIKNLDWMSEPTKEQALHKLNSLTVKIGYPDKWRDYSKLDIKKDNFLANVMNANEFEMQRKLNKIGKPVDRTEWGMTPPTVNAYYNPTMNEIVFPAGILQPPYFDYKADAAVNYGGMGAVIGHEITHGFDDQGRQFDAEGNMKDWWTEEDARKFDEKAARVIKQYDGYEAIDSSFVNGKLTVGENIADLGGVAVAYDALQLKLKEDGRPGKIGGYTPEQRFFMSWASVWRSKYRDEMLRQMLITDVHSPGNFRAIGPPSNMEEFYKAFQVKPGNKMYRDDSVRAVIW